MSLGKIFKDKAEYDEVHLKVKRKMQAAGYDAKSHLFWQQVEEVMNAVVELDPIGSEYLTDELIDALIGAHRRTIHEHPECLGAATVSRFHP